MRNVSPFTALVLLVAMNTAAETSLFDFSAMTNTTAWQIVNDDVMGGVSTSRIELTNDVALFHGAVSLENRGGFASVRSLPNRHCLTNSDAFMIRVRGDGRRYKFTVRTDRSFDSTSYQTTFQTKAGEWQEHRMAFKNFIATFRGRVSSGAPPMDPAQITSVGSLISDQQAGPFRLEIAWIRAGTLKGE